MCLQSVWPLCPISWPQLVLESPMDDLLPKNVYGCIFICLIFLVRSLMKFFTILLFGILWINLFGRIQNTEKFICLSLYIIFCSLEWYITDRLYLFCMFFKLIIKLFTVLSIWNLINYHLENLVFNKWTSHATVTLKTKLCLEGKGL